MSEERFIIKIPRNNQRGAAIIIVLAFVVLLTGIVVAMLTLSLSNLKVSENNAEQLKADLFAKGAVEAILGDLKQEIVDGSTATVITNGSVKTTLYTPKASVAGAMSTVMPADQGFARVIASGVESDGLNNLLKRSAYNVPFYDKGSNTNYTASGPKRAANISSTVESANGRAVSLPRWNKPLLLVTQNFNDPTAAPVSTYNAPDWILVGRDGSNPSVPVSAASAGNLVVGRYAYNVYDEGGLLDVNVAGYPSTAAASEKGSKTALAYSDLGNIFIAVGAAATPSAASKYVDQIVAWRNYASLQPTGSFTAPGFSATSASTYYKLIVSNLNGFLGVSNTSLFNSQSDRIFASRQELQKFLLQGMATTANERAYMQSALLYLGTFSRGLNQPSYAPPTTRPKVLISLLGGTQALNLDDQINPAFLSVRVPSTIPGGRNDATDLTAGEPLVKKRFNLNRLAWVTWEGPSASASTATKTALLNAGIPQTLIDAGTTANIQKYFGLNWVAGVWKYNIHNGGNTGKGAIMRIGRPLSVTTPSASTYVQDCGREPDFFELLKGAIQVGTLGKAAVNSNTAVSSPNIPGGYFQSQVPANFRYARDSSVDYQIIQIGANIIDQFDPDSLPVRIVFDDNQIPAQEFDGIENLPYLAYFVNGMLRVEAPSTPPSNIGGGTRQYPQSDTGPLTGSPGAAVMLQIPALWNPHDVNGAKGTVRPTNFRIITDSTDPITAASGSTAAYTRIYTSSVGYDGGSAQFAYDASSTALQPANSLYAIDYTKTGRILDQSNTALTFSDSNGTLFREPTLLLRRGGDINLQSAKYPTGIQNIDLNPVANASDPVGTSFLGIVLGIFPLRFDITTAGVAKTISAGAGFVGPGGVLSQPLIYLTYRVQYENPASPGQWITYDTKYGRVSNGRADFNWNLSATTNASTIIEPPDAFIPWNWASTIDPRTPRFGFVTGAMSLGVANAVPISPADNGWVADASGTSNPLKGITFTLRPDNYGGHYFVDFNTNITGGAGGMNGTDDPVLDNPYPLYNAGWTRSMLNGYWGNTRYSFNPGMLSQNSTSIPFYIKRNAGDTSSGNDEFGKVTGNPQPTYYADPDGIVRRATGAYVPVGSAGGRQSASTTVGLPLASTQKSSALSTTIQTDSTQPLNQAQSRPLILNRPFRSVAELGYVFRDTPWKNLDFFTPESGDAALLDVFCMNDTDNKNGLVAGKINLNSRSLGALTSIVSGAYIDDPKVSNSTVGSISSSSALTVAAALVARTTDTASDSGPLQNVSELVGKWIGAKAITASTSYVPANATGDLNSGNGYKDGRLSYAGFSGSSSSNPPKDLGSAFASSSFSSNVPLQQAMAQIQRFHEAPIRALAELGQTRVWNLLIDVVAQTGRYPQASGGLDKFVVQGEQRYWVHVAIDRFTGAVLDSQFEVVKE